MKKLAASLAMSFAVALMLVPSPTRSADGCCETSNEWVTEGECEIIEYPTCGSNPDKPCKAKWNNDCSIDAGCDLECKYSHKETVHRQSTRCDTGCDCILSETGEDFEVTHNKCA